VNVILAPELHKLLHEKLQSGEYRSADEVINAAMRLLQQHDEDRQRDQQRVQQPADDTSYAACL